MRSPSHRAIATLLLLAPAGAWVPADAPLTLAPQSRLWVEGTSTVRGFQCKAPALEADVSAAPNAIAAVLAGEKGVTAAELRVPAAKMDCGNGTMNEHMLKALKAKEHGTIVFKVASYDVAKGAEGVTGTLTGTLSLGGERGVTAVEVRIPAEKLECGNGTMNEHMLKALKASAHPTITFRIASYDIAKADTTLRGAATGELTLGGVTRTITVAARLTGDAGGALRIAGTHELNMREYGLKPPALMMGTMRVNEKVTVGFDLRLTD